MKRFLIIILIACFYSPATPANDDFTSPSARGARDRFRLAVSRATEHYLRELKTAQDTAMRDRQLEEAARIKAEIQRLEGQLLALSTRGKSVTVPATASPAAPLASGVRLAQGQRFKLEPNPTDRWSGGGSKTGEFSDYRGYPSSPTGWMTLMYRVGTGPAAAVESGTVVTSPTSGELVFFANDRVHTPNVGQIRVVITVE